MKIILKEDIKKLGKKGDIVEVSDGQGRNFLIPKNMAIEATSKNVNLLNEQNKATEKKEQESIENAKLLSAKIENTSIHIRAKENNGKLFGSITNAKIAIEFNKLGIRIDKKNIEIKNQITQIGSHKIRIKLYFLDNLFFF